MDFKNILADTAHKKSQVITAISEATKQEIIKYTDCDPDKVKVVPVAISDKYRCVPKDFNHSKPVILNIGMAPNKNLIRLIEAIEGLEVHLCIVGKLNDEYIAKLKSYNIEYSNAFGISDEEMIQKYIDCDLMAFVSTYEGFGMPILEAQATGRVVITSDVSSMPEVAGFGAHFIDPFEVSSIRTGILKVINDATYRDELIDKGFKNIQRYNPDRIAGMYEEIYHEVYRINNHKG
ncbi:MAG: glycosyltransferase family 4 protein [Saprospiraceae bacterium]|nr:glycosyltransferase family 4 protein [Saprospiraceae bacterium]